MHFKKVGLNVITIGGDIDFIDKWDFKSASSKKKTHLSINLFSGTKIRSAAAV